ncbi:hypothetical protein BIW11_10664 [Tropilaelaps mercedesae]|uniref:PR domain zinc finger protein-like n=1 Tax=Tropilaelaps mercedesae TaxID=418985 RepID=A0A1V9XEK3_9ACAR|nr:hypothetical protein BIW11_10664 [Tropilaelaps mercedesae]
MSLGQDLVVWPPGLVPGDLESYYDERVAAPNGAAVAGVGGLNSLAVAPPSGLEASSMGMAALGAQAPATSGVFEMSSPGVPQGVVGSLHQHTHPHSHHHGQHQAGTDRQPPAAAGPTHDTQLVNESYAQAYVAAVSLAARFQPPQFTIGDDIATDADMADLPEVLDLHQPALSHRGSMACTQDAVDGTGSLVLLPQCPQDQASALQTAVLPVLHLDKNALLEFLQAPQPAEHRTSTQRYFDGSQGTTPHSASYSSPTCSSQGSLPPYGLETYNYSSLPILTSPPINHHGNAGQSNNDDGNNNSNNNINSNNSNPANAGNGSNNVNVTHPSGHSNHGGSSGGNHHSHHNHVHHGHSIHPASSGNGVHPSPSSSASSVSSPAASLSSIASLGPSTSHLLNHPGPSAGHHSVHHGQHPSQQHLTSPSVTPSTIAVIASSGHLGGNGGSGNGGGGGGGGQNPNQNYPINHKQMLAQKYAAEELQNSAYSQMIVHGGGAAGLGLGGLGVGIGSGLGLMASSPTAGSALTSSPISTSSSTIGVGGAAGIGGMGGLSGNGGGSGPSVGGLQLDCSGVDPTGLLHPQLFMGTVDSMQAILCKDGSAVDLLEGAIAGVDLSLSKSHANTSLCPQNRIPSHIVNVNQRQDGVSVVRPPKKDRGGLQTGRRSPMSKDDGEMFCEECGLFYEKECLLHRVLIIEDETVQSRVFASLPSSHLLIQDISSSADGPPIYGVFSRKNIPRRTMFGPMEGVAIKISQKPTGPFPIFLSEDVNGYVILDTRDEERSNWMSLVRTATSPAEQNMAIVQQGGQIFFKTITQILPKTELKVWYSDAYAQRYRLPQDVYECFDCGRSYSTTDVLLQHMVNEHSETPHLSGKAASTVPGHSAVVGTGVSQEGQLCQVRKPKMPRYPSGGQWQEAPTGRQQHSTCQASNAVFMSTINEVRMFALRVGWPALSNASLYMVDPLVDAVGSRKSKRGYSLQASCAQELMSYNPEKALDAVEIIEHITQTMGPDCGGSLQNELMAAGGYGCIQPPISEHTLAEQSEQTQQQLPSITEQQHQQQQQQHDLSSQHPPTLASRENTAEFFTGDRCVDFPSVEAAVQVPVEAAVQVPVGAPVQAPVEAPVQAPVEAPVQAPVEAAVQASVEAAVQAPVEAAVQVPVEAPVQAPVETPPMVRTPLLSGKRPLDPEPAHASPERRYDIDQLDMSPTLVIDDADMYPPCKKKRPEARERGGFLAPRDEDPLPERVPDEPRVAASKISKFLQRRHEEVASRSPDATTASQLNSALNSMDSSVRSDETTSDSSGSSVQEGLPPLPQQKRFIKNIKNKHYVRADSNLSSVDNLDSPLPSEESACSMDVGVLPAGPSEPGGDGGGDGCAAAAVQQDHERAKSPKATFMTPLKKKLPKSITEEVAPKCKLPEPDPLGGEVQSAEVTSAGMEFGAEKTKPPPEAPVASGSEGKRSEFPCLVCDQSFPYVTSLRLHSKEHSTPEGYKCPRCPRVVGDFFMLRRHIRLYHIYPTTKSLRCDTCGKTFCQTDKFKRHIRVHETSDKKFKCDICGKILSRKDKLADHVRNIHSEENTQENCRKAEKTSQPTDVRKATPDSTQPTLSTPEKCRLKREGAGIQVRSFHCDRCGRGFRKRGMLAQHYAKQHPELPPEKTSLEDQFDKVISEFPCPYCDKSYKSSTKRKQHIEQNHPKAEVPQSYKTLAASVRVAYVRCPWCPSQYTVRCKLYAHQRAKHQKLLDILNVTGITEESWEKIDLEKKATCMEIQAAIEAELLQRKKQQEDVAAAAGSGSTSSHSTAMTPSASSRTKSNSRNSKKDPKNPTKKRSSLGSAGVAELNGASCP